VSTFLDTVLHNLYKGGVVTPYPRVGDVWRSRDARDHGLTVTVLTVDELGSRVQIKRSRRVWVRLSRWAKSYEFVRNGL